MKAGFIAATICLAVSSAQALVTGAQALGNLQAAAIKLDDTLAHWDGGPFTLFPLGMQTQGLLQQVNTAVTTFQNLRTRSEPADNDVLKAAQLGVPTIDHILKTVVASKDKFDKIPLGVPIMFGILKALQIPTNKMTSAIVVGASPANGPALRQMQDQVKQLFVDAMNSFDA